MAGVWVRDWKIPGSRKYKRNHIEVVSKRAKEGDVWPYKVSQKADGSFGCDCPAWISTPNSIDTGRREDCKHILRVKLQLMNKGEIFLKTAYPSRKATQKREKEAKA